MPMPITSLRQQIEAMTNAEFIALLKKQGACLESIAWVKQHGGTTREMWRDCKRADWIGWFIKRNARLLYISDGQWAECLADCIANEPGFDELKKALRQFAAGKLTHGELEYYGYNFGLTKDLTFPAGRWPMKENAIEIVKHHFPIFGEE